MFLDIEMYQKKIIQKTINQMGWNIFSIKYVSDLLRKNRKVKNFKFHQINYPKNLKVLKKTINEIMDYIL